MSIALGSIIVLLHVNCRGQTRQAKKAAKALISAQRLMFDIVLLPARATCAPNPTFVIRVGLLLHVNCVCNFHTCDFHKMTKIAFPIIDAVETGNCLHTRLLYGGPRTDYI